MSARKKTVKKRAPRFAFEDKEREFWAEHDSTEYAEVLAVDVSCTKDALRVVLSDGRTVTVPLAWFPRLLKASSRQRTDWELIGGGIGIHWESVDEDISVASLLQPENFIRLPNTYEASACQGQKAPVTKRSSSLSRRRFRK